MTYSNLIESLIAEWRKPVTVTVAARLLGIAGKTPAAAAQKLRRLERRRALPRSHRSLAHGDRFWFREELAAIRGVFDGSR